MSGLDVAPSSPPTEETKAVEAEENGDLKNYEPEKTGSGPAKPFNRLMTTSAVAAALAEVQVAEAQVERPKRRRIDRCHSAGLKPLVEVDEHGPSSGYRTSAPTIDPVTTPIPTGSESPRSHLKRATSAHLAGFRERLKAGANATTASANKRTPSIATTPTFKRIPSSRATPTFRSVAKAVAASTTITSDPATTTEKGRNYEQMMARFRLRRLESADSNSGSNHDARVLTRHNSAYMPLVDSEISQRRVDDLIRSRSEGETMDNTIGCEGEVSSQSRINSRPEESPRHPGAPSFHSDKESAEPPATASITPVGHLEPGNGALAGSMLSIPSVIKKPQPSIPDHEQTRVSQQGGKHELGHTQQRSTTRKDSEPVVVLDQNNFRKFSSQVGSRPRLLPRIKKRTRSLLAKLRAPLSPLSRTARVRSFCLVLAFCVHTLCYPYEEAFHAGERAWFISVDAVTEMIFFTDFLLVFNTSYVNKRGVLVVSRRHIAWNFFTGAFVFHLLATLPFVTASVAICGGVENAMRLEHQYNAFERFSHTLADIVVRSYRIVHILGLLSEVGQVRVARTDKSVLGWLLYSRYSHLLRIVWIVGAIMLIAHCVACCWRLLLIDSANESIAGTCGAPIDPSVELDVYAACFYVAMQLLLGQSISTNTARENIFASCVNLLGSIALAVIFGEVAMLVANFNANSTAYQRKMESVFAVMTKMQLPAPLRERIHQYYAHLWREYEALYDAPLERFAKELSHNLTLEVVLFKYMELAMHVPFWENCSPDFQKMLVLSLDTRVYLPDDFIVRRGEVGDEFYMINRGMCELVGSTDTQEHATDPLARRRSQLNTADTSKLYTSSHDGTVYLSRDDAFHPHGQGASRYAHVAPEGVARKNDSVKTLTRGQALGEMALLMNYQRTANVRAMTYVEMCVLSRTAFQAVLTRYPADRKQVISQILITSLENNERFGIPCPLTAMVRSVFADEADGEKLITPRRAAKLVAYAINPDAEDDSIKFALSAKLKEQLIGIRDQEFIHTQGETPRRKSSITVGSASASTSLTTSPTATTNRKRDDRNENGCGCHCNGNPDNANNRLAKPDPEMEAHVLNLESVQAQTFALLQELQRGAQDTLGPP